MFEGIEENSNSSLLDGLVISNRYEIIRCLGSGAMGSVHLARDRLLSGNVVALKVLKREIANDQNVRQRFLQEVKLMHRVNHPNVVRTYDVGVDHDLIYFTMEYVTGVSLEKLVQDGGIDLELFIDISLQICAGLGQIHAADIIHRDLKPANVMLADGKVKITDFGVARSSRSELTQHKEIIGSTPYIAPEIWMGGKLTQAADFYSLGAIFFELLIGHPPFEHDVPATIMWMHLKKSPDEPKSLRAEIPEWLNALIIRMLAKSSENRPSSAEEIYNYIQKRIKISKNPIREESSEIPRIHYCSVDAEVISNLASNLDEECCAVSSKNSDLFVVASAPKSHNKNTYTGFAIKEFVANAFSPEGLLTPLTLSSALSAANNVLLTKRREQPEVTGISASLTAVAVTPDEILLSFAGNCAAYIGAATGFRRLTEAFPKSASWALGTTLPQSIETYRIQYNTAQSMRILLITPGLVECIGGKDIEVRLQNENFNSCLDSMLAEAIRRRPHLATTLMFIEIENNGPHYTELSQGQVMMSLFSYDHKSRAAKSIEYKAFLNQDELNKSNKALVFDEIEKPKNILFEDPKESILFASLPSTDEIIRQQESLAQFSKQRIKRINDEAIAQQNEILVKKSSFKNKILIILIVNLTMLCVVILSLLLKSSNEQKRSTINTNSDNQVSANQSIGGNFSQLVKLKSILQNLSKQSDLKNILNSSGFPTQNQDLKRFAKESKLDTLSFAEVVLDSEKFSSNVATLNIQRYEAELKLAELNIQLKVTTHNSAASKNNLLAAQRKFHDFTDIVKSLSSSIISQKKSYLQWLEFASRIEQNNYISLAQELALKKWADSPHQQEAIEVWQKYIIISERNLDSDDRLEVEQKLQKIVAEIIQVNLQKESENLLKMLLLVEEARFKREIKQIEITNWRKAIKNKNAINTANIKKEIDKISSVLKKMEGKLTQKEMLLYRALQEMV